MFFRVAAANSAAVASRSAGHHALEFQIAPEGWNLAKVPSVYISYMLLSVLNLMCLEVPYPSILPLGWAQGRVMLVK